MTESQLKKITFYTSSILQKIHELIEENELHEELEDSDNATAFIHAFATIAPHKFFEMYTKEGMDHLGFNHVANRLIVQFASGPKKENKTT